MWILYALFKLRLQLLLPKGICQRYCHLLNTFNRTGRACYEISHPTVWGTKTLSCELVWASHCMVTQFGFYQDCVYCMLFFRVATYFILWYVSGLWNVKVMRSIQMGTLGCFFCGLRTWVQSSHTHQVHGFRYVCFRPAGMCINMVSMWRWKQWRGASPSQSMRCRVMGSQFIPYHLWAVVKCHVVQLLDMETVDVLFSFSMLSFGSSGNFSCGVIQGVPAVVLLHGFQSGLESDGGIVQLGTQL